MIRKLVETTSMLLFLSLLMCACDQESSLMVNSVPLKETTRTISMEEAIEKADKAFQKFYGTKAEKRSVSRVELLINRTRATDDQNADLYVINYEDEGGFALVSANPNTASIYGLSDSGSLYLSDTIYNKGLSWYLNSYIKDNPALMTYVDTISTEVDPVVIPKEKIYTYSEPLLKGFMSQFGQGRPYNLKCPKFIGEPTLVGCTALAAGTIMGFFQWPNEYQSDTFNWNVMSSQAEHIGWPKLFKAAGNPENLDVCYGIDFSWAYSQHFVRTFTNMGYTGTKFTETPLVGWSSPIINELEKGYPVIVDGLNQSVGGHAWIIDGGFLYKMEYNSPGVEDIIETYYHCVWGLSGKANGYFLMQHGTFSESPSTKYDHAEGTVPEFQLRYVIHGFRPNR